MIAAPSTSWEFRRRGELEVLGWPALGGLGVDAVVTTRAGGVSGGVYESLNLSFSVGDDPRAVLANRQRVAAALDGELAGFVFARQVHGGRAEIVTSADRGRGALDLSGAIEDADALVTSDPRVTLAILVGDCVPIVLYDPVAGVLACVHAGWRGAVAQVGRAALAAMSQLGGRPADVLAGIGPAIGPDRYQVGPEVAEGIRTVLGADAGEVLVPDGTGRWRLDLWAANARLLARAGVPDQQIHVAAVPTGPAWARPSHPRAGRGAFFSDRTARPCGRFALVARLQPGER